MKSLPKHFVATLAAAVAMLCLQTGASEKPDNAPQPLDLRSAPGYQTTLDRARRLRYVSALDKTHQEATQDLLARFSEALGKTLGVVRPQWDITIVLPTSDDYAPLAPRKTVRGFYRPSDRTLISIDRGRTLLHEFTHALHHADAASHAQYHPVWVCEGLATLFEACEITSQGLQPRVDMRVITLWNAIRSKRMIPLERLVTMEHDAFAADAQLCYAQVRYLMLYLHQAGKLTKWYEHYKANFAGDNTGKSSLEHVLNRRLPRIQRDWLEWITELELPCGESQSARALLGLQMRDTSSGVKVVGFAENGAAKSTGHIRKGDILLEFNGRKIADTAEAVAAINAAGAMQTATIKLKRIGKIFTISQPLGAPQAH